jgi:hypothetical protein
MRLNIMNEIKHTHPINSNNKAYKPSDVIPDEKNKDACLSCPLKDCKSRCGRLKRGGSR